MESNVVTEPVSLFIKKTEIDQNVLAGKRDDPATAYIIYQNNHLLQQYLDEVNKTKALEKEKEELEEFNDKLEQTRTCLLGYVKNEHEVGEMHKKLCKVYRASLASHDRMIVRMNVLSIPYALIALGALVTLLSSVLKKQPRYTADIIWSSIIILILFAYIAFHVYVVVRAVRNERYAYKSDPDVVKIHEEISNTKKSNSYIQELLDSM